MAEYPKLITKNEYFKIIRKNYSTLLIEPTLKGLLTAVEWHWRMADRSPEAFNKELRNYLYTVGGVSVCDAEEIAEVGILSASPVLKTDGGYFLLRGDNSGLTAFQCLTGKWFIEAPLIQEVQKKGVK